MTTVSESYVTTDDGLRLFVRRVGEGGDIVLFLNGVVIADDFAPLAERHTMVFFDNRNRGRSDAARDRAQIERGIHHDIDDLETLRRHFGVAQVDVIGHSYAGFTAAMYAITHPSAARRIDRKSTRLNSSHLGISYAVFCLKKKRKTQTHINTKITEHTKR